MSYVLIPAVRTMEQATQLLNELANARLRTLAQSPEYQEALQKVNDLRDEAVANIQSDLEHSISSYLPNVSAVDIRTRSIQQSNAIHEIVIDDGFATPLAQKGDGIKSLFSLALIQHLARERSSEPNHSFILLVDEPETHLHSRAIHDLQMLFTKLARSQQVLLATHNPIFVNRERVASNIIVRNNKASAATSVSQIRDTLGVQLRDNLDSAEVVVLTEGWTDARGLPSIFKRLSTRARADIETGRVIFKAATGAGKIRSHLLREQSTACRIIVVLDDDPAGSAEAQRLIDDGMLNTRDIFILRATGRRTSEFEDLIEPDRYLDCLSKEFGRTFTKRHFNSMKKKWSDSFNEACLTLGVAGVEKVNLQRGKEVVVKAIELTENTNILREGAVQSVDALYSSVWPIEDSNG